MSKMSYRENSVCIIFDGIFAINNACILGLKKINKIFIIILSIAEYFKY